MAKSTWNSICFLLFTLFIFYPRESSSLVPAVCSVVNCGQGTCVQSASLLGFDCECDPGWKKMKLGLVSPCLLPNCTVNFQCGSESWSDEFQFVPKFDISDPCSYTWCGDGTCVSDGAGHYCKCNQGSSNLFNINKAACFKQCNLGTDCDGAALRFPATPAQPTENQSSSAGAGNGNDHATQAAPANYQSNSASAGNENINQSSSSSAGNENVNRYNSARAGDKNVDHFSSAEAGNENVNQSSSARADNGNVKQSSSEKADNQIADVPTPIGSRAVASSWNLNIIYMALLTGVLMV